MENIKTSFIIKSADFIPCLISSVITAICTLLSFLLEPLFSITVPLFVPIAITLFAIYNLYALSKTLSLVKIDRSAITVRSLFKILKRREWRFIDNITVLYFENVKYIQGGRQNIGGISVVMPYNVDQKWIMLPDDSEDFCRNIYEFYVPNHESRAIKLPYREDILTALQHYSFKQTINTTIK